jgi:hypothetical protein
LLFLSPALLCIPVILKSVGSMDGFPGPS